MGIVCLDTQVIIWGYKGESSPGQEQKIFCAKELIKQLKERKDKIIIPSVVVAELLLRFTEDQSEDFLKRVSQFYCPPFDLACGVIFAKIWRKNKDEGIIKGLQESGATRQELKADCFIVATAIRNQASLIYSEDKALAKFAGNHIEVKPLPSFPEQMEFNGIK